MAKLNGVQIKSLKSFRDHEGALAFQGTVYVDGKKQGFWSQSYMGAIEDDFDFDTSALDAKAKQMVEGYPEDYRYKQFVNKTSLLADLVTIADLEKQYKKFAKQGYCTMASVTDGFHFHEMATTAPKDQALDRFSDMIQKVKETEMFRNEKSSVALFGSLDDFDITVDKDHPIPDFLCNN